mmetsp:Transcript_6028/g.24698  ORF Transcript_6028/g.24698 Transcript_6028/m.24698 type:complete len:266 (+) Transcript_6028:406-1203(+)
MHPQNTSPLRSTSSRNDRFRADAIDAKGAATDGSFGGPSPRREPSFGPTSPPPTSTAMGAAASREVLTPPPAPASVLPPRLLWPLPPLRPPRTTSASSSSSSSPGCSIEKMASSLRAACPRSLDASLTGAATDGDGRGASADDAPGPTPPAAADDVSESDVSGSFEWIPRASARSAAAASAAPPGRNASFASPAISRTASLSGSIHSWRFCSSTTFVPALALARSPGVASATCAAVVASELVMPRHTAVVVSGACVNPPGATGRR